MVVEPATANFLSITGDLFQKMNILITGGAGYIGSVATELCIAAGHDSSRI